ncbi:MAG: hypothetical protein O3A39_04780 [Proteobacteria bacterium]|nr:hypothetical protein [Pseudomonadota bacterium]
MNTSFGLIDYGQESFTFEQIKAFRKLDSQKEKQKKKLKTNRICNR